ncbi:hypothetical protein BDFB_000152 [Asbolus verrucosus]|uniref:EGF-like domain-containing protein n=1 Tax=Asbolus verrucosus TaxID=1661398 RepID=A0A482VUC5_ASBVE|nr:hypothetical protein BDFB_000152 [Asbolus verrucosus]
MFSSTTASSTASYNTLFTFTMWSERSIACINSKCADPCPGTCGQNAQCQVINHLPSCTCNPGYTGDPFRYCNLPPENTNLKLKQPLWWTNQQIHVNLVLVVQTVNVVKLTNKGSVLVFPITLEVLQVADLNVLSVQNVLRIRLV